jgi:ankyrin repeat protein
MESPRTKPWTVTRMLAVGFLVALVALIAFHERIEHGLYGPLCRQVGAGNTIALQLAVTRGFDVNKPRDTCDVVLLFSAVHSRKAEAVAYLLAHGADPNVSEKFGLTPLEAASRHGDLAVVRLLIEAGADVSKKGENGTPLDVATRGRHTNVMRLLTEHGAVVSETPDEP